MNHALLTIGCLGKKAYVTMSAAWKAIRKLERRHVLRREKGRRLEPYRCTVCHQHHIGSSWTLDTRQRSVRPSLNDLLQD